MTLFIWGWHLPLQILCFRGRSTHIISLLNIRHQLVNDSRALCQKLTLWDTSHGQISSPNVYFMTLMSMGLSPVEFDKTGINSRIPASLQASLAAGSRPPTLVRHSQLVNPTPTERPVLATWRVTLAHNSRENAIVNITSRNRNHPLGDNIGVHSST